MKFFECLCPRKFKVATCGFALLVLASALPVLSASLTSAEVSECIGKMSFFRSPPRGAGFFLADCNGRWTNHYFVTAAHVWGKLDKEAREQGLQLFLQVKAAESGATIGAYLGTDNVRFCPDLDIAYVQVYGSEYNRSAGRGYREVVLDRKLVGRTAVSLDDLGPDICHLLPSNALAQCGVGVGTELLGFCMRAGEIVDADNLPPWAEGCRETRGQVLEMARMMRFDDRTPSAPYYQISNMIVEGDSGSPVFAMLGIRGDRRYAVVGLVTGYKFTPIPGTGLAVREGWITSSDYIIKALPAPSAENAMDCPSGN